MRCYAFFHFFFVCAVDLCYTVHIHTVSSRYFSESTDCNGDGPTQVVWVTLAKQPFTRMDNVRCAKKNEERISRRKKCKKNDRSQNSNILKPRQTNEHHILSSCKKIWKNKAGKCEKEEKMQQHEHLALLALSHLLLYSLYLDRCWFCCW